MRVKPLRLGVSRPSGFRVSAFCLLDFSLVPTGLHFGRFQRKAAVNGLVRKIILWKKPRSRELRAGPEFSGSAPAIETNLK